MLTDFMSQEFGKRTMEMAYLYSNEVWDLGPLALAEKTQWWVKSGGVNWRWCQQISGTWAESTLTLNTANWVTYMWTISEFGFFPHGAARQLPSCVVAQSCKHDCPPKWGRSYMAFSNVEEKKIYFPSTHFRFIGWGLQIRLTKNNPHTD